MRPVRSILFVVSDVGNRSGNYSVRAARTTAEVVTPRNRATAAAGNPNSPTHARQNTLRASETFRIRLPERSSISVIPRFAAISRARVSKYLAGLDPPAHDVMQGPGGIQSPLSGHVLLSSVYNRTCQVYSEATSPIIGSSSSALS